MMIEFAMKYLRSGLSIIPTYLDEKRPVVAWKKYQSELPTESFIKKYFSGNAYAIAMICGQVSGNVELIDIDNHFGDAKKIFDTWKELVENTEAGLFEKLVIETTQSGGYHIIYRCETPGKNTKLARRAKSEKEIDSLIETRGEGGYALIAPSPGYKLIQGDFDNIARLTKSERDILLTTSCSFNEFVKEDPAKNPVDDSEEKPGTAYNKRGDVTELMKEYGWVLVSGSEHGGKQLWRRPGKDTGVSATFGYVKDKLFVFSTSCFPFESDKSYDKFTIYTLLKHKGVYSDAAKDLIKSGYGKSRSARELTQPSQTKNAMDIVEKKVATKDKISEKKTKKEKTIREENPDFKGVDLPNEIIFWYEKMNVKGEVFIAIDKSKLIEYLEHYGFAKIWIDRNTSALVRIENNIVTEYTPETIIDFLKKSIHKLPFWITENKTKHSLWEAVLQKIQAYKATDFLSTFEPKELNIVRDTKDEGFVFFRNCIVKATKDSIETLDYSKVEGHIWSEQIIQHDFKLLKENIAADTSNCMFGRFLERVCSPKNNEYPEDRSMRVVDEERLSSLCSAIGYLLHTYKDPALTKAVIFCEERIADADESNGRTGKGLTVKAISEIRKMPKPFNAKAIDFNDRFVFQEITQEHQVLIFDDARKHFDFEALFSILTEGFTIERKGQKSFFIPYEKSPKVIITTNSVISNDSDSHKARKFEFEYSDYFTELYTPVMDLGGMLFHWEKDDPEWDRFYNFMVCCIKTFITNGLMKYQTVNLEERKLRAVVPEEFLDMAQDWIASLRAYQEVNKSTIYEEFTNANPIWGPKGKRAVTQNKTTKWFKAVLDFENVDYEEKHSREITTTRKYFVCNNNLKLVKGW